MSEGFAKNFGGPPSLVKETCILLPSNDRNLFKSIKTFSLKKGLFFDLASGENISIISLKDRSLAGDCVMELGQTRCRKVILFGSCGGLSINIALKAVAAESLNLESFSYFLTGGKYKNIQTFYPPGKLTKEILKLGGDKIKPVRCATVSSFYLQEKHKEKLKDLRIDCLDMESSMVFSAAEACSMEAAALFYCSDTPGNINYYDRFHRDIREKIKGSRRSLALMLMKFLSSE